MTSRTHTSSLIWVIFLVDACRNIVSEYRHKVLWVQEAFPTAMRLP